jgi:hypothetical protein
VLRGSLDSAGCKAPEGVGLGAGLNSAAVPPQLLVRECLRYGLVILVTPDFGGVELPPCYSRTSVAPVLTFRDHRIEPAMVQQPSSPHALSTDFDHDVLFGTRCAPSVPTEFPAQSAGRTATARQARVRTRAIRQVVVVEVAGLLSDVGEELDRAIQLALAEGPRGVVCDFRARTMGPTRARSRCWRWQGGTFATGPASPWP